MKTFKEFFTEGLWDNINRKKKEGRKSSHGNSKAHKDAVKAGNKLEKGKSSDEEVHDEDAESSPGRVKRAGASCKGSATELRKKAKKYGGEKGKMYHWCANMKKGKKDASDEEQRLDDKCWDGYKKQGTKMKGGKRVNNCVKK